MELVAQFLGSEGARMVVGLIAVIALVSVNALFLIWMERKVAAHMQLRPGPMEVGPHGAIQTVADAIKLMGKELITPEEVDKPIFWLAPIVIFLPVLLSFLVIPFSSTWIIKDMNVGIVLILAFSTLSVLAILMAGWSSNNKYAVFGAIRSVAQNMAYEIPLLVTVMSIILMVGSFKLTDIVAAQSGVWFIAGAAPGLYSLILSAPRRRPTGPPSTSRKRNRNWWPGSTPNIPACGSPSSSWRNTPTCSSPRRWPRCSSWAAGTGPSSPGSSGSSSRSTP